MSQTVRNPLTFRQRLSRLLGSSVVFDLRPYDEPLAAIRSLEEEVAALDDAALEAEALRLRQAAGQGESLGNLRLRSYALAGEAARRLLGLRPYDVQIVAALALDDGKVVEMQTGEGKTLAAVLPAFLNALSGRGVHVLTFNDYLARRDAEWMGPVYRFLGLTVGHVGKGQGPTERRNAYAADVTYATAQEAGFDHLRDLLATAPERLVHRPFHFALVDEADSLLIDEARVPLVIAGESEAEETSGPSLETLARLVDELRPELDFDLDEYGRNVELTDTGYDRVEALLSCGDLLAGKNYLLLTQLHCALHARVLLRRDVDYIVRQGRVELVDEFTGRVMEDRHWPDGLQAALEAKEGLRRSGDGRILGSIAMQHFLSGYPRLCGMTGTAQDAAQELEEFYDLGVVVIPTHRPMIRIDRPDVIFRSREAKETAVVAEIRRVSASGRPVLVGTLTVAESERLAARLQEEGVACTVLNARNDELEAKVIAGAGSLGAVTISTNMAGRGTDIQLDEEVARLGGLFVLGTNRHESRRVDLQLRGRAGRQGDPGESCCFLSLEDDLLVRYGIRSLIPARLVAGASDAPWNHPAVRREIARAQRIIEGQNFEIRRTLWRYAQPIEEQRREMHGERQALLTGEQIPQRWRRLGERCTALAERVGEDVLRRAEVAITLFHIDRLWRDHLARVADLREGTPLVRLAGEEPLTRFCIAAAEAYGELREDLDEAVLASFDAVEAAAQGGTIDLDTLGLRRPSSTWTYLINDDPFREQLASQLSGPGRTTLTIAAAFFLPSLLLLWAWILLDRFARKRRRSQGEPGGDRTG